MGKVQFSISCLFPVLWSLVGSVIVFLGKSSLHMGSSDSGVAEDERREKIHQWKRKLWRAELDHARPAQEATERDHQVSLGEQGK